MDLKHLLKFAMTVVLCWSGASLAATCTSKATGNWGSTATWSCVGTPAATIPGAADTVILASPFTVTLNASYTVSAFTINSGATLSDTAGSTLTVTGNIANNGTFTSSNSGILASTGNAAVISGTGTFSGSMRVAISGTTPSIAAGSNLNFAGTTSLRAGRDAAGNTIVGSTLTINGTLTSAQAAGTVFLRLYGNSTVISGTGVINAPTAGISYRSTTATLTNNGSVNVQSVTQNAASTTNAWTQGSNASLTVSAVSAFGVLNASATGNTVSYNSPATPVAPSSSYYNLAGTAFPAACPVAYTVTGSSPCASTPFVQSSPTSCTSATGVGTVAWATPANAVSSNNVYATASNVIGGVTTNYLNCTGFNLAVPAGASISGITVYVERNTSGGTISDAFVYLIKAGVISTALNGVTATAYPTADTIEGHGGQNNLWATTWTPADLNAANFGVAFAAKNTNTASTTNRTISIDHIQVRVDYTIPTSTLHHVRIEHDGAASTCAPEPITLKACANAACTSLLSSTVSNVGLSPTASLTWTPGSTATITSGVNSATTLASTAAATVALAIAGTTSPAPVAAYECYNTATASSGGAGSAACNLVFTSNSFAFNVLDHTAGTPQVATVTSCTAGFANQTRAVKFWSTYLNPTTGTLPAKVVAGSAGSVDCATGYANLGTSSAAPTTLSLAFGAGTAPTATFSLCYPDVGSVSVDARYDGSAATADAGVVILGNDAFIAKPDHFTVSNIKRTSDNLVNPAAVNDTGGGFVAAGDSTIAATRFTATVTAKNARDVATPNYGLESPAEGVMLTLSTPIVAPSGGYSGVLSCKGALTTCMVAGGSANFAGGATTITDLAWSEVGIMQMLPTIGDGSYLNTGDVTTPTRSGNIGRFYPHHFAVTPGGIDDRTDLCQAGALVSGGGTCAPTTTYMGEQMEVNFTLSAQNAANVTTQNYTGLFAKLNPLASNSTLAWAAADTPGVLTPLTSSLDTSLVSSSGSGNFNVGVANMNVPLAITRSASPVAPYTQVDIGIAPVDSDGVATILDFDTDGNGSLDHTLVDNVPTEVRYGRIYVNNAHGSERLPLTLAATMQYWNGSSYVTNTTDNETSFNSNLSGAGGNLVAAIVKAPLASGNIAIVAPAAGLVVNGVRSFTISAPNVTGSANFSLSGLPSYLPSIAGRATFGVYAGNPKIIDMRESF